MDEVKIAQRLRAEVETLITATTIKQILAAQSEVAELALLLADRKTLALVTKPRGSQVGDQLDVLPRHEARDSISGPPHQAAEGPR